MDPALRVPIRVQLPASEIKSELSSAQRFWRPYEEFVNSVRGTEEQPYKVDLDEIENAIHKRFPEKLKQYILSLLPASQSSTSERSVGIPERCAGTLPEQYARRIFAASGLIIYVEDLRYSSLDFDVLFYPLASIVDVFERNFDYFENFSQSVFAQSVS